MQNEKNEFGMRRDKQVPHSTLKAALCAAVAAIIFLAASCGGGFGTDSGEADELGPALFGKDSTR